MGSPDVFRSKVDWWLVFLAFGLPFLPVVLNWTQPGQVAAPIVWILAAVLGIAVIVLFPIRYVIEGRTISVQCGLIRWEYAAFDVDEVRSVRPTHNPLASAALSLDRLNVDLGFRGNVLISPKNKAGFLRALTELDPKLQLQGSSLVRET
jgi:hypothetical protein